MPEFDCSRCGTTFDTERDHKAGDYADTTRCAYCGKKADTEPGPHADGGETIPAPGDVDEVEVTVTVRFQFRGE